MRTALILARKHGEEHLSVISGPEVPVPQQVDRFKGLIVTSESHDYAEVQLWDSDSGMTQRKRFRPPLESAAPVNLAEELANLDDAELQVLVTRHVIALNGVTEKADIIKAIVLAIRARHNALPKSEAAAPVEIASEDDPGVFAGPTLPPTSRQPSEDKAS